MKSRVFVFLALLLLPSLLQAKKIIFVDLDRSIFKIDRRILAIAQDIGQEGGIPQLAALKLEDVKHLRNGEFDKIGLTDAKTVRKIFGDRRRWKSRKKSEFGKRFYKDPSYLKYDEAVEGAPEFLEELLTALKDERTEIVYLTGRLDPLFRKGTLEQLRRYNFPGFGSRSKYKKKVRLVLKPVSFKGPTENFKKSRAKQLDAKKHAVLVVDDEERNLEKLSEVLPAQAVLVQVDESAPKEGERGTRVYRVVDFTNKALNKTLIEQAQNCGTLLEL